MEPAIAMTPNTESEPVVRSESGRWPVLSDSDAEAEGEGKPSHSIGEVFGGRYELLAPLGEGGMGAVWRAHCAALDIDVALKVLHKDNGDDKAAARLLREARSTASLHHPAIVRTLDFGTTDEGSPFLVMELLEGTSLAQWLDEHGRMPASQAVQVLLPIADALSCAHEHGIVHRDVKPANIIVAMDRDCPSNPKIFDFGIAKVAASNVGNLTQEGAILGSVEYMSPEQASGYPVGPETDVWAFCVLLYELITGQRPFQAPSLIAMIHAVYTRTPTPTTELAAGDDALWQIIERGLRKSAKDRWPSMNALGRALAAWSLENGTTVDASVTSLRHQWFAGETIEDTFEQGDAAIDGLPIPMLEPRGAEKSSPRTSGLRHVDTAALDRAVVEHMVVEPVVVERIASSSPLAVPSVGCPMSSPPAWGSKRWQLARIAAAAVLVLAGAATLAHRGATRDNEPVAQAALVGPSAVEQVVVVPAAIEPPVDRSVAEPSAESSTVLATTATTATAHRGAPSRRSPRAAMPLPSLPNF